MHRHTFTKNRRKAYECVGEVVCIVVGTVLAWAWLVVL